MRKERYWLTKKEYIEKYGEEAWLTKIAKHRESSRKYRKEYYAKNRESILEERQQWRKDNPEEARLMDKKKREKYRDKRNDYSKQWRDNNSEYFKSYSKSEQYRANRLLQNYKRYDNEDKHEGFNLTKIFILENIFKSSCVYCGDSNWRHLGCDRIDNERAHTQDNVVCSCGVCNVERYYKKMSVEEFVEYRKTHPRDEEPKKLQEIVEVNGKKVIRKVL